MNPDEIEFRDASDRDAHFPSMVGEIELDYQSRWLRWFCPSLTPDDAKQVYLTVARQARTLEDLRAAIRRYYAEKGARGQ